MSKLSQIFKLKQFDEEDILNWCQEVETIYIADPDSMAQYMEIPLEVTNGIVQLPSNIYKMLDVYNNPRDNARLTFRKVNQRLTVSNYADPVLYINYIGTPLNEDCIPLIHEDHQPACETYCKINAYAEEMLLGKINQNEYADWKIRFDGMIQSAKGSYRDYDNERLRKMDIILGSQIPKIGFMPLAHNLIEGININD